MSNYHANLPYADLAASLIPGVLAQASDPASMEGFYASNLACSQVMDLWRDRGSYGCEKWDAQQASIAISQALVDHYEQIVGQA